MDQRVIEYLDSHKEEMIESARELIEIESVALDKGTAEFPFGEKSAEALNTALRQFKQAGFKTENIGNYCGYADLGDSPNLGILAHVDVVPAGDGWDYPPFSLTNENGILYGRGITDDKGPLVCVLYAMRAIKELGIPLKRGVRVIIGASEENGSEVDLQAYEKEHKWPEMVFTPDAEYPIVNFEAGRVVYFGEKQISENTGERRIASIFVGTPQNAVPGLATAVVYGVSKEEIQNAVKQIHLNVKFEVTPKEDGLEIHAEGFSTHAAKPEPSINALTGLLTLLHQLSFQGEAADLIANLLRYFPHGDKYGKAAGIYYEEKMSGCTTFNLGTIQFDGTRFVVKADVRYPLGKTFAEVSSQVKHLFEGLGLTTTNCIGTETHYVDENSRMVRTLAKVLHKYIDVEEDCVCIRGGTYVHEIENGVAFGPVYPGEKGADNNNIHGINEYVSVEDFLTNAKIYAEVIMDICG